MVQSSSSQRFTSVVLTGLLLAFLTTTAAFASDTTGLFQQLKNSGISYEILGTICEQAARLQLTQKYPTSQYLIVNDIIYEDGQRTIGELDEVVFDRSSGQAVLVGEVKCWSDLEGALQKARNQRQRFLTQMKNSQNITFSSKGLGKTFPASALSGVQKFVTISQRGGRSVGFDLELNYSLEELLEVRTRLIDCQLSGQCR
jgi:hypothetical protein